MFIQQIKKVRILPIPRIIRFSVSLEQLAAVYDRRTSVAPSEFTGGRRKSLYVNPQKFEHPEHHHQAREKVAKPRKVVSSPVNSISNMFSDGEP